MRCLSWDVGSSGGSPESPAYTLAWAKYLRSCCEEYGITKVAPKLPPLERLYADLIKKGQDTPLTPEAHERFRRTLGRLAWASLSRPDCNTYAAF